MKKQNKTVQATATSAVPQLSRSTQRCEQVWVSTEVNQGNEGILFLVIFVGFCGLEQFVQFRSLTF